MPFFSESSLLQSTRPLSIVPKCGICKLYQTCQSPKMKLYGKGKKEILIVGEAPGKTEDERNRPFCGETGTYLKDTLRSLEVDMDRDCWQTNSLICRPPENETPTDEQIEYCYPNLKKVLDQVQPRIIITVGLAGLKSAITGIWTESVGNMGRWAGWQIPCRKTKTWICPTYHPSFIVRESQKPRGSAAPKIFRDHLKAALQLEGHPSGIDLKKNVHCLTNEDEIINWLMLFKRWNRPFAFDYETNMLKPGHKDGYVYCVSVSNWDSTIAFPWSGAGVKSTFKLLLRSDCPKIAHNMKFEDNWSIRTLGIKAKNWIWDTMVQAHVIDNRSDICSLSFQSFVNLGMEPWGTHIGPLLEQDNSYDTNRVKQADLDDLLLYNGMDSLATYRLAVMQRKILGLSKL